MPLVSEHSTCLRCRERVTALDMNVPVFLYSDLIAGVIARYKLHGQKRLAPFLSRFLYSAYCERYPGLSLVPVPFRPVAKKKRGWDQVEELVGCLNRVYGIPVLNLLKRRNTAPQKSLGYVDRLHNLEGAISSAPGPVRRKLTRPVDPLPHAVVLVDDVYTTGSTLNECAKVLKLMGIETVYSLTLAIDP